MPYLLQHALQTRGIRKILKTMEGIKMKRLKNVFKFNIDDEVKGNKFHDTKQAKLRVVCCEIEICPGGARLLYQCRTGTDGGISTDLTRLAEHEIEACNHVEEVEEIKVDRQQIEDVFKFKIGSTVKAAHSISSGPVMFEVVSCWAEKCMGVEGEVEQFHYNCRQYVKEGIGIRTVCFNEYELQECDFKEELKKQVEEDMENERINYEALQKMRMEVRKKFKEEEKNKDKKKEVDEES